MFIVGRDRIAQSLTGSDAAVHKTEFATLENLDLGLK